jgi:hypothetical protein
MNTTRTRQRHAISTERELVPGSDTWIAPPYTPCLAGARVVARHKRTGGPVGLRTNSCVPAPIHYAGGLGLWPNRAVDVGAGREGLDRQRRPASGLNEEETGIYERLKLFFATDVGYAQEMGTHHRRCTESRILPSAWPPG